MASQKTRRTKAQIKKDEIINSLISVQEKTSKNLTVNVPMDTHTTLAEIGTLTGKTKNEIVESAINYLYWELQAQLKNKVDNEPLEGQSRLDGDVE